MWILVGALIGAVAGAAGSIISAKLRGQPIDWKDVGAAALTGAVTGAIASATLGTGLLVGATARTVGGAALGAAAGAIQTGLSNEFHGRPLTQGMRNAVIAGAVGGAVGGFALGPVARSLPAPTLARTVISGSTGNAASQVTENALEGRPLLENVPQALATGGIVAAGAHQAATRLAPRAEPAGTVPRVTTPRAPLAPANEPLPVQSVATNAPPAEVSAPLPPRGPPAQPVETSSAPAQTSAPASRPGPSSQPAEKGVVQALEELEAGRQGPSSKDATQAPSTTGANATDTGPGPSTPTSEPAPTTTAPTSEPVANPSAQELLANRGFGDEEPKPSATQESTRSHLFEGETETAPQSPYNGKWNGKGIHDWDSLVNRVNKDGFKIAGVTEDPASGTRRVAIERTGTDPKTGRPVTGTIEKTMYPRALSQGEIEAAGNDALTQAVEGAPGTKLEPFGTKMRADGVTKADGYFEATSQTPAGPVRVQGWFRELPDGTKVISSHAPRFDKNWPAVAPENW